MFQNENRLLVQTLTKNFYISDLLIFMICGNIIAYKISLLQTNSIFYTHLTTTALETTSTPNNRSTMLTQVANSKGTEWMVTSYNEWQQRSPLPTSERNPSTMMRLAHKLAQKENQMNAALAFSYRTAVIITGLIISFKSR
jgi:hypothetical protein